MVRCTEIAHGIAHGYWVPRACQSALLSRYSMPVAGKKRLAFKRASLETTEKMLRRKPSLDRMEGRFRQPTAGDFHRLCPEHTGSRHQAVVAAARCGARRGSRRRLPHRVCDTGLDLSPMSPMFSAADADSWGFEGEALDPNTKRGPLTGAARQNGERDSRISLQRHELAATKLVGQRKASGVHRWL